MINRINTPSDPPTAGSDWTRAVTQLARVLLDSSVPYRISGSNVLKGSMFIIGGAMYVADSDTGITGTASAYVKITAAGDVASAAFVANLSGVSWNDAYNGYYDGAGAMYIFDEMKAYGAGAIASLKTVRDWVPSLEIAKVLSAIGGTGWSAAIAKALVTSCLSSAVTIGLPCATYTPYNRSASGARASQLYNNSGWKTFARLTFDTSNRVMSLLGALRLHITNGDSSAYGTVRAVLGGTVLDSWTDAADVTRDITIPGGAYIPSVTIDIQYLEYGASAYRGPFAFTASIGLVDDADLPSLNELIYHMTCGNIVAAAGV